LDPAAAHGRIAQWRTAEGVIVSRRMGIHIT